MKKILIFFVTVIPLFSAVAFEPEKYIKEEVKNIARIRSYDYYYDWGEEATPDMKRNCEKPIDALLHAVIESLTNYNYEPYGGKPRTIAESKLFAEFLWAIGESSLTMLPGKHYFIIEKKRTTLEDIKRKEYGFIEDKKSEEFKKEHPFWDYYLTEIAFISDVDKENYYYNCGKNISPNQYSDNLFYTVAYMNGCDSYDSCGTITSIAEARRVAKMMWLLGAYFIVRNDFVVRERK